MRLEILNVIHKLKSAYFADIHAAVSIAPADLHAILRNLIIENYLYPASSSRGPYRLTDQGREYRLELEKLLQEEHQQQALNKAADTAAKKAKIVQYLIDFVILFLGAALNEFGVFHALLALFQ